MPLLRSNNHNLNSVLFPKLMSDWKMCPYCLDEEETVYHFLIKCPQYDEVRLTHIARVPLECWNISSLLFGLSHYNTELNSLLQSIVQEFKMQTGKFQNSLACSHYNKYKLQTTSKRNSKRLLPSFLSFVVDNLKWTLYLYTMIIGNNKTVYTKKKPCKVWFFRFQSNKNRLYETKEVNINHSTESWQYM